MFSEKTQMTHMSKMTYFQKVRKCLLNIDGMLNILQKKDQNIYFTSDLHKR